MSDTNSHRNTVLTPEQSLDFLKRERRAFYDSIGYIVCPILEDVEVHFTAQGFNHLLNETNSKEGDSNARNPREQYLKLMNLGYAPYILKECEQVAEIRPVRKKVKGKWKDGYHYELTCDIENVGKVSVIVEKIGDGKHKFLSVFPLFKKRKSKKRPGGRS